MDWITGGVFIGGLLTGVMFGSAATCQWILHKYRRDPHWVRTWLEKWP